jgi:glycosyltransferase involved in cell wall biosynthesis
LIQPSLSEGFGLTGLEAMTQGVPLLASDTPIFREIYQDGAWYFNPKDPTSLIETIAAMTPNKTQEKLVVAAERAKQFSWQKMTEETVSIYQHSL